MCKQIDIRQTVLSPVSLLLIKIQNDPNGILRDPGKNWSMKETISPKSRVRLHLNKKMRFRRKYLCKYLSVKMYRVKTDHYCIQ
jgi:hypothetical protein